MSTAPEMTAAEYTKACERLGISVYRSAKVLGVHLRTAQAYSSGERRIPKPVQKVMRMMARYEIDPGEVQEL
jgi:hypothetical protein